VITRWPAVIMAFATVGNVRVLVSALSGSKMNGFQVLDAYPNQASPANMLMTTSSYH